MEFHYIISLVILFLIIYYQRKFHLETKSKINSYKSIFPIHKFKIFTIYIPENKIESFTEEDFLKSPNVFKHKPTLINRKAFVIKVYDEEFFHSLLDFESVVRQNESNYYELLLKKGNKTTFANKTQFNELIESGWVLAERILDYIEVTRIEIPTKANNILKKILNSINTYLLRNKGAITDFNLVKDIVERNCDAEDEEINTLLPIPLYLGLMGTMLGIIVGVGYMAIVGFDSFLGGAIEATTTDSKTNGIEVLMGSVGVAMIASFVGLAFTTFNSGVFYKKAKSDVESQKNDFYTFIQTELLPSISNSATNSILTLQNNLLKFNDGFTNNVDKFDNLLQDILSSFKSQMSIVEELKEIDVAKLARLNIDVLKELRTSTLEFEKFNHYLGRVNEVIDNATQLNTALKSDLDRIGDRKEAFEMAYVKINDSFESGIKLLKTSNDERLKELKHSAIIQQDAFEKYMNESSLTLQTIVDDKNATVVAHVKQNNDILVELQKQTELRSAIDRISGTLREQNNTLSKFTSVVESLNRKISTGNSGDGTIAEKPLLKYLKYTFLVSGIIIGIGYICFQLITWFPILYKLIF